MHLPRLSLIFIKSEITVMKIIECSLERRMMKLEG